MEISKAPEPAVVKSALRKQPRRWPLKAHLLALALTCTLPIAILVALLSFQFLRSEYEDSQTALKERVELLLGAVELRVEAVIEQLRVLAASPALKAGDMQAFHRHAAEATKIYGGIGTVLLDRDGQQIINSRIPFGDPLPKRSNLETLNRVFTKGAPEVSDLVIAAASPRPIVSLEIPIVEEGSVRYVLATGLPPTYLSDVMKRHVPAGWVAGIVDRKGILIARTPAMENFVGRPVTPHLFSRIGEASGHWIESISGTGVATYSSFLRSDRLEWTVAMGLPRSFVDGKVRAATLTLVAIGMLATLLSVLAAIFVSRRIVQALTSLEREVVSMGTGGNATSMPSTVEEVNRMQLTLREVGARIRKGQETIEGERSLLKATVESMPVGVLIIAAGDHEIRLINKRLLEMWGLSDIRAINDLEQVQRLQLDGKLYNTKDWPIMRALRLGQITDNEEVIHVSPGGARKRVMTNAAPVHNAKGDIIAAVAAVYDVTELRDALTRQNLLLDEINHRVKNTMATIQSIVHLTKSGASSIEDFASSFQARLLALSAAYDLLTYHHWEGAELSVLLERMLAPYCREGRLVTSGPVVHLNPKLALSLTAALQELATNAAKYGALSNLDGEVHVEWHFKEKDVVQLNWTEHNGPSVTPPKRKGFGTKLIQDVLAREEGWSVNVEFNPNGFRCALDMTLRT